MGTTTANFNLIKPDLTDPIDVTELNENFDVIDARLKDAIDAAESVITGKLLRYTIEVSDSWFGVGPYTQDITIAGALITPNSKVDLQPDATAINQLIGDGVKGMYVANNNGSLTLYAIGAMPTAEMEIQCTITDIAVVLTGIEITELPSKLTYAAGTVLDMDGLEVTATYSDGSTDVVDSWTSVPANGQALLTIGTQTVTVSYAYQGITKTATFDVDVEPALSLIEVTSNPTTSSYVQGDTLDLTGLEVTATYSNADTVDVTADCVCDPAEGDELTEVGLQEVEITYTENGVTCTTMFTVDVSES